jgi:hypothetical protein
MSTKIYEGDELVRFVAETDMPLTIILRYTYITYFVMIVHHLWFRKELNFLQNNVSM